MAKKPPVPTSEPTAKTSLRGKIRSDFPKHTLDDAIRVGEALEHTNGGKPLPPVETAVALNMSPGSSTVRTILAASIGYGLTEGGYWADRISLTPLGQRVVAPTGAEDRHEALVTAAFNPPTFRRIYEYFKGKKLPETNFFENAVVRDFDVPREHAKVCVSIFRSNMTSLGLVRPTRGGDWLTSEVSAGAVQAEGLSDPSAGRIAEPNPPRSPEETNDANEMRPLETIPSRQPRNAIFVAHGKNKKPLEQLKQILDQYQIPHKVAVDEANTGRPVSQKVADVMHECGAAILIFTADEEFKDDKGQSIWRPSDNVVYELGAAAVLYGGRIIVFREEGVDFPSNFRDIGYITFEKDALANKTNELFKELIAFGLIKVSVGA